VPKLREALELFLATSKLPKIDIKLTSQTADQALVSLINELHTWIPREALINVDGNLKADDYMNAEAQLQEETGDNVLLNIDLGRYRGKSHEAIVVHLHSLSRLPFSISPNLDDDIEYAIEFAKDLGIPQLHFWANFDRQYTIGELYEKMKLAEARGLVVYFDIKSSNIVMS
jgi:hypothetical protein